MDLYIIECICINIIVMLYYIISKKKKSIDHQYYI